eukprot:SAG31_NODE_7521_length_1666_cov_1.456924_2_plen_126_part_00
MTGKIGAAAAQLREAATDGQGPDESTDPSIEDVHALFDEFDTDHSGHLEPAELKKLLGQQRDTAGLSKRHTVDAMSTMGEQGPDGIYRVCARFPLPRLRPNFYLTSASTCGRSRSTDSARYSILP